MNIKPKFTRKTTILALVVLLALIATIVILFVTKNSSDQTENQSSSESSSGTPQTIDEPAPEGLEDPQVSTFDVELPEGTISPHTVASDPDKYLGKEINIRGLIIESSRGQYSITGQKPEEELGLRLDFTQSDIDPQQYSNSGYESTDRRVFEPVTIVGKLKTPDGKNPLTFEVKSIQK
ncbi:MAG: hypothetical protein WD885_00870 [Candidatus Saccharimonadales bacterium]